MKEDSNGDGSSIGNGNGNRNHSAEISRCAPLQSPLESGAPGTILSITQCFPAPLHCKGQHGGHSVQQKRQTAIIGSAEAICVQHSSVDMFYMALEALLEAVLLSNPPVGSEVGPRSDFMLSHGLSEQHG